ncbi:MAG: AAA family ATPase [Myxococcales bacterium]|nr:AAA family ATPase [Myxococcales bacterium]
MFGRTRELADLRERVRARERLITIVGPAGVGKTRLLLELARSATPAQRAALEVVGEGRGQRHRPALVVATPQPVFCDLSAARSAADVVFRLARALEVELSPMTRVETTRVLAEAIERRARVLLIDNVEQVVNELGQLVGELLELSPTAKFVLTSRVPVGLPGETLFRLQPLATTDAVALLLEVVREHAPEADWERAGPLLLENVVNRVDRLPLALKLVGARARLLSPERVLENLGGQLDFLRGRRLLGDERHASMRAALDWSWELLGPEARRAVEQLSVFVGGFDVDAAAAVLAPDSAPDALSTVDVLETLLEHSLLQTAHAANSDVHFSFYVCARELGQEHLARSGRERAARERHAAHFSRRVDAAVATSSVSREVWAALEPSLEDLAAAAAFSRVERPERAARLLFAQSRVLAARAPLRVQRELLEAAMAAARTARDSATEVLALHALNKLLTNAGFLREVLARAEAGLTAVRALGDALSEARLLSDIAYAAVCLDREALAREALTRARDITERTGDVVERARLVMFGAILDEAPIDASVAGFERMAAMGEASGDRRVIWFARSNALEARQLQGTEPASSRDLAALGELDATVADRQMSVWHGLGQARQALVHAELRAAEEHAGRASAEARAFGSVASQCVALALAAEIALDLDDGTARGRVLVAQEVVETVEHRWARAHVSWIEGHVHEDEGDLDAAGAAYASVLEVRVGDHLACFREDARLSLALLRIAREGVAALPALAGAVEHAAEVGALGTVAVGAAHVEAIASRHGDGALAEWGRARTDEALERVVARRVLALVNELRGGPSTELYLARRARRLLAAIQPATGLTVAADLAWLEVSGKRTSLGRRGPMRRILCALLEHHARHPGVALPHDEVCRVGWPGERMRAESARDRVYNVVRLLRRSGLESKLVTTDAGYLLDRGVSVQVAPA